MHFLLFSKGCGLYLRAPGFGRITRAHREQITPHLAISDCRKAGLEKEWGRSSCRFYAERELSSESKKDSKSKSSVKGKREGKRAHGEQITLVRRLVICLVKRFAFWVVVRVLFWSAGLG